MNDKKTLASIIAVLKTLNVSEDSIQRIFKWSNTTLAKALRPAGVRDEAKRQKAQALLSALESAIESTTIGKSERVDSYIRSVSQEFDKLTIGDHHILVSLLPPLECVYDEVASAVVKATRRGVCFEYWFLSDEVVRAAFPQLKRDGRPLKKPPKMHVAEKRFAKWDGGFGNIPSGRVITRVLQGKFLQCLHGEVEEATRRNRLGDQPWATAVNDLKGKVVFRELGYVPVLFNEKLTWCSSSRQKTSEESCRRTNSENGSRVPIIRKEIVLKGATGGGNGVYRDDTEWARVPLQLPEEIVDMLLSRDKRSEEIPWPAAAAAGGSGVAK